MKYNECSYSLQIISNQELHYFTLELHNNYLIFMNNLNLEILKYYEELEYEKYIRVIVLTLNEMFPNLFYLS